MKLISPVQLFHSWAMFLAMKAAFLLSVTLKCPSPHPWSWVSPSINLPSSDGHPPRVQQTQGVLSLQEELQPA